MFPVGMTCLMVHGSNFVQIKLLLCLKYLKLDCKLYTVAYIGLEYQSFSNST